MFAEESTYYYKGCIGGKTGFTNDAGSTLVTAVKRKKGTYIAVTMKAAELGYAVADSTALFDYAYQNFTKKKVEGGKVLIPKGTDVDSLTVNTEPDGENELRSYYFGDYLIGSASVAQATPSPTPEPTTEAEDSTEADSTGTDISTEDESGQTEAENTTEKKSVPAMRKILLMIMGAMILILIALLAALGVKEKKHKKKHKNKHK